MMDHIFVSKTFDVYTDKCKNDLMLFDFRSCVSIAN